MNTIVARLDELFTERSALVERYAELWAVHGGGSSTWEDHLVELDTAALRAEIRAALAARNKTYKEVELKEALLEHPNYQNRVRQTIEGRTEWARVRENFNTLGWRIQLEMAKLRLALGEEASSTLSSVEGSES